jgi:hypothetical protein
MLLRLPSLALTSMFTLVPLPISDVDHNVEILALRQLAILQRQIDKAGLAPPGPGVPRRPPP